MKEKIKIKVSSFLSNVLENDAYRFGFMKNGKSNKNALLNKLIPTLVEIRKLRRDEIDYILTNEYNRDDSERIYSAVNTVIDRVYFRDAELDELEEYIWIRPSKDKLDVFDEIQRSEVKITALETSAYIRGLLNEYVRLPQYKREMLVFDKELDIFDEACSTSRIIHFTDSETNEKYKAVAFSYYYGYLYNQTNYCVILDLINKKIKSIPLHKIKDAYLLKQKYNLDEKIIKLLLDYVNEYNFENEVNVEDIVNVF